MKKEDQIAEIIMLLKKPCDEIVVEAGLGSYCARPDSCDECLATLLYNAGYRKQSEWISVEERLPTHEENDQGLVGIVNGHNGKIGFMDAFIFVDYDFDECEWFSDEYDLANCKVDYWMVIPIPTKMKGGANSTHTEVSEDEQEI